MSGVREWYQQMFFKKKIEKWNIFVGAPLPKFPSSSYPPPAQGDSNEDVGRLTFSSFWKYEAN